MLSGFGEKTCKLGFTSCPRGSLTQLNFSKPYLSEHIDMRKLSTKLQWTVIIRSVVGENLLQNLINSCFRG